MLGDAGIGTYLRNLVPRVVAARPEWHFTLLGREQPMRAEGWHLPANVTLRDCRTRIYTVAEQVELVARRPSATDLFWSPHYNIPLLHRGPLAVTVHDVSHLALPQYSRRLPQRMYAKSMFAAVGRRADAILCVSAFSRGELLQAVDVRSDPVVVHPGVEDGWYVTRSGSSPRPVPYVVFVGSLKPHKNLVNLIRAFERIQHDVPHQLVIAGRREGMRTTDSAAEQAAEALGSRVAFTGELPIADLRRLVAWAEVLVMPSLYEGFGFPPLEAMAAGCPTLVSRAASLPEVCGDASLYCNPTEPEDIAAQLRVLLGDESLRARLRAAGAQRVREFTWERCTTDTLGVLEATL